MWLLLFVPVALAFGAGAVLGAPYLPILRNQSRKLLDLTDLRPGQTIVDLGSGDGRLLKAAAKRGVNGIGYEINPFLHAIAVVNCWKYRKYIKLHLANYWHCTLPQSDVIYMFLIDSFTHRMVDKLRSEVHQPTLVVSYVFDLPGLSILRRNDNAILYQLPGDETDLPDDGKKV